MLIKTKNKYKPVFKQLLTLRENPQNRAKILKFKKEKWQKLLKYFIKNKKKYKKFKPLDQSRYIASIYPSRGKSYSRRYRDTLHASRRLRLLYGNIDKLFLKKTIKAHINTKKHMSNLLFIDLLEKRLDIILYRSKFSTTVRSAKQLIVHGKILVNNNKIKSPGYILKSGDLISINPNYNFLIKNNIKNSQIWPLPPKNLIINYKTLEIFFVEPNPTLFSNDFSFNLNIEKLTTSYLYQ